MIFGFLAWWACARVIGADAFAISPGTATGQARHSPAEEVIRQQLSSVGPDLLLSEVYAVLESCSEARDLCDRDPSRFLSMLPSDMHLRRALEHEVLPNLACPWEEAVTKWRRKALAVEKYRCTNPQLVSGVYTFMANTCLLCNMPQVAYEALSYSGIVPAGPLYVTTSELDSGDHAAILDFDKLTRKIAVNILDYDLSQWQKRAGAADEATGYRHMHGVGVEESNFWQNEEETMSHEAALRIRDLALATTRVAARHMIAGGDEEFSSVTKLVILAGCTSDSVGLSEILCLPDSFVRVLALDAGLTLASLEESSAIRAELGQLDSSLGAPVVLSFKK